MRLPWTIWRHVFAETWRLLLLTTVVLTVVTAFGITVRYTASGKLSPLDTIKFMGLAVVPMLQYVLPFAAGFGATLAYHRMTHENELTAAKAGGISHRALLVPALVTGLIVAAGLSELNGSVIPRFLRSMESMVAQNAAQMVVRTISMGQPIVVKNRQIYADAVYDVTPETPMPGGPSEVLMLTKVLALQTSPTGEVEWDATAAQATLAFFPAGESGTAGSRVVLELKNARAYEKTQRAQAGSQTFVFPIQGMFNDNPRYNTNRELAELPADPDRVNFIDAHRRTLAQRIAEHDITAMIGAALRTQGQVRLTNTDGRTFALRGSGLTRRQERWEVAPSAPGRPIEVERFRAGARGVPDPSDRVLATARTAGFTVDPILDPAAQRLTLTLELEGVTIQAGSGGAVNQRERWQYTGLLAPDNPLPALLGRTSADLLAEAQRRADRGDAPIDAAAHELRKRLDRLLREAVSHQHERAALAGACLVMVLIGALTAMRMGDSLPLTVYLWSFFPALLSVVSIATGQTIAYQVGDWGLYVLWAGLGILGVYGLVCFWIIRRH